MNRLWIIYPLRSIRVRSGLIGPNGAGKTTTLMILCGLLKPTSGNIRINGSDLSHDLNLIKKFIGVVSQEIALYEKLTAYENLYYFGRLFNINKKELNLVIDALLSRMGLFKYKNEMIEKFSGGMKRRINILAGLLHNPKLLILDEHFHRMRCPIQKCNKRVFIGIKCCRVLR